MKRFLALIFMMLAVSVCAASAEDGSLSVSMDAPAFCTYQLTSQEWMADDEHRAMLTAVCWLDYSRLDGVTVCPEEALAGDTMVCEYSGGSFLFIVIPVEDGRLTFYCLPEYHRVSYMWEGGDYSADVKQEALEQHGMTVYRNSPEAVAAALAELRKAATPTDE